MYEYATAKDVVKKMYSQLNAEERRILRKALNDPGVLDEFACQVLSAIPDQLDAVFVSKHDDNVEPSALLPQQVDISFYDCSQKGTQDLSVENGQIVVTLGNYIDTAKGKYSLVLDEDYDYAQQYIASKINNIFTSSGFVVRTTIAKREDPTCWELPQWFMHNTDNGSFAEIARGSGRISISLR